MMLKEKLLERLKEYEKKNKKLSVKWNTGGDETIVNFFLEEEALGYPDELVEELASYLIEEFNLPNAGEYYNDGGGKLSIENENRILLTYDEFAYGESYGDNLESENIETAFSVPSHQFAQQILKGHHQKELDFYGSTSFLLDASFEFEIFSLNEEFRKRGDQLKELHDYIRTHTLAKFAPPFEAKEICYAGKLKEEEILFEELYQIKYYIDKNKKEERKFLFE